MGIERAITVNIEEAISLETGINARAVIPKTPIVVLARCVIDLGIQADIEHTVIARADDRIRTANLQLGIGHRHQAIAVGIAEDGSAGAGDLEVVATASDNELSGCHVERSVRSQFSRHRPVSADDQAPQGGGDGGVPYVTTKLLLIMARSPTPGAAPVRQGRSWWCRFHPIAPIKESETVAGTAGTIELINKLPNNLGWPPKWPTAMPKLVTTILFITHTPYIETQSAEPQHEDMTRHCQHEWSAA